MSLNEKQKRFAAEYIIDLNATQAAIRAGYSKKTAGSQAHDLLKKPEISAEIKKKMKSLSNGLEITAERVLKERARLAFFDPRKLLDSTGRPKAIHDIDDDTAAAIAGLEVSDKLDAPDPGGERTVSTIVKYKMADKNASLTALEKHLGLYKEDVSDGSPLNIHIHLE